MIIGCSKSSQTPAGTAALWTAGNKSSAKCRLLLCAGERQAWGRQGNFSCPDTVHSFCFPRTEPVWKTCPTTQPSTAACSCHKWHVSLVRPHQQGICITLHHLLWGGVPLGHPWGPSSPVCSPKVTSCEKSSFYRKLRRALWFCFGIPKYTTFFLILYDLQLPHKNKLSAGE